jgi:predicted unusual protein kinase regulating ubiquinone biosynthesis (AarF/ABC1/UbiB family)
MDGTSGTESAAAPGGLGVRLRAVARSVTVVLAFLPLFVALARDRRRYLLFGGRREVDEATRERRARYLLETLLDLGPTFIKLGQILSTRPDALPRTYIDVLSELQDRVPPAEWAAASRVLEEELGPVEETFDEFDREAISGASLGQVYTARVGGQRVAVKVLRPGIRETVEADLRVIGTFTPLLARFAPPGQSFTLSNLAEEFAATIRREMDYEHEAEMLATIDANFADDPDVRVPDHLPALSTDRVLTMEYVGGGKITDEAFLDRHGIAREALVRRLSEAYIQMILEDGVFHADPHPGNLAVKPDGTVVFYDFGMTGRVDAYTRDVMFDFYVALVEDDIDAVLDAFVAMGALDPAADRELMREVFDLAIDQFRGEDITQYDVAEIVSSFEAELYDFPMRLPQNLALVVRVTTVLDGVIRSLVPDFDFIPVVTEYVRERQGREGAERVAERVAERGRAFGAGLVEVPPRLNRVLRAAERESLAATVRLADDREVFVRLGKRLAAGLLFGSTALAVTLLYAFGQPVGAAAAAGLAVVFAAYLYRSFRSPRGTQVRPQFTRYELRQRRE